MPSTVSSLCRVPFNPHDGYEVIIAHFQARKPRHGKGRKPPEFSYLVSAEKGFSPGLHGPRFLPTQSLFS